MNRLLVDRLYWSFWLLTTMLTGVLSGYMVSHSIMLGQFFNWFIESGNLDLLHKTYTVFRAGSNAYRVYDIPLLLHLVAGTLFVVLTLLAKRHRIPAVLAGLSTWWVSAIFIGFDVGSAEDAVLTGVADHATTQYFLAVNLPAHASFAVIYLASMALLLAMPLLDRRARPINS